MGMYAGELKTNKITVRCTDTVTKYINFFQGKNISEKFENMIHIFMTDNYKKEEAAQLQKQVEELANEKEVLLAEISKLKDAKNLVDNVISTLDTLNHTFVGEMIDKKQCYIQSDIKKSGFKPNKKLIEKLDKLNKSTNRNNSIRDIADALKNDNYKNDPDTKKLVEEIGQELKEQEMERLSAEPDV